MIVVISMLFLVHPMQNVQSAQVNQQKNMTISGRVTDGNGNGVAGAIILAVLDPLHIFLPVVIQSETLSRSPVSNPIESGKNYYTIETDAYGNYDLDSLPPGRYVISARTIGQDLSTLSYIVNTTSGGSSYDFHEAIIPTVYTPGTITLSEATLAALVSITSDGKTYTFANETSDLAQADVGDVLIGGICTLIPEGFLRKVVSISANGDQRVVVTEPATLEDAFESISVNAAQQLTSANVQNLTDMTGVTLLSEPSLKGLGDFEFALNDAVLYDNDGNLSTKGDQIVANGLLSVSPDIEFRIRIENGSLEELYYTSTMSVSTGFTVSSKISLNMPLVETKLIPTIPLGAVPVGPLVLTPELDLIAGITGSVFTGISATITNTTSFTAGLWQINHETRDLNNFTSNFSFSPLSFQSGLSFKAYIGPKVSVKIYGVVGGYVKPGFAFNLTIAPTSDPWLTLKGGFEVSVGVSVTVPIIGKNMLNIQLGAINHWILLYSLSNSSTTPPNPPSNPSPPDDSTDQSLTTYLSWIGGDPDGDTVAYDVYLNSGVVIPTTKVSNYQSGTIFNPGTLTPGTTYSWRVWAFDQHGVSTSGPVWRFTTGNGGALPGVFGKVSPANNAASQPTNLTLDWGNSNGATSYAYCYDTNNDIACSSWISTGATSQATISGLSAITTYYWQVRATNTVGDIYANGSPTAFWAFTTESGTVSPGEMMLVPAGEFQMGCDSSHNSEYSCWSNELPLHTVYLDDYLIDKTEVTNAQYAQCVAVSACTPPTNYDSSTRSSYYDNPLYADYPVINLNWYQSSEYCTWAGKRLPTEAEWEKAARGTSPRAFPWGDTATTCGLVNGDINGYCVGDTNEVGSYLAGASPYGTLDMAGNVWEWVNDWYDSEYYSTSPYSNPPGPVSGYSRILRGGGWAYAGDGLRTAFRLISDPSYYNDDIGFRCVSMP